MDNLSALERAVESSPLIVLLLMGGLVIAGRVIKTLFERLDKKDEHIINMQTQMVLAVEKVNEALENLTKALRDADKRP